MIEATKGWVMLIEATKGRHLGVGVCPCVEEIFYDRIVALRVQEAKVLLTLICVTRALIYKEYREILIFLTPIFVSPCSRRS